MLHPLKPSTDIVFYYANIIYELPTACIMQDSIQITVFCGRKQQSLNDAEYMEQHWCYNTDHTLFGQGWRGKGLYQSYRGGWGGCAHCKSSQCLLVIVGESYCFWDRIERVTMTHWGLQHKTYWEGWRGEQRSFVVCVSCSKNITLSVTKGEGLPYLWQAEKDYHAYDVVRGIIALCHCRKNHFAYVNQQESPERCKWRILYAHSSERFCLLLFSLLGVGWVFCFFFWLCVCVCKRKCASAQIVPISTHFPLRI